MKFESNFHHFHSRKCIRKCHLPNWRLFCPGGVELTRMGKDGGLNPIYPTPWLCLNRIKLFIGSFKLITKSFQSNWDLVLQSFSSAVLNYANPVYGVATFCHQVRWLRWGHPSLFHTAMSLLIWYKNVLRERYIIQTYMDGIYKHACFPYMHNLGRSVVLIDKLLWF